MLRRNLLKAIAAIAGSARMVNASRAYETDPTGGDRDGRKESANNFVEATDGTILFFRDSGALKPMLFAAPWAPEFDLVGVSGIWLARKGMRCVTYDRRGHGRSGESNQGCNFDTLADDMATILEHLDVQEVTLVGQSLCCGEVVRYLTQHRSARVS